MTENELKVILQKPYSDEALDTWRMIFKHVIPGAEFLLPGSYLPLFEDESFVTRAFQYGSVKLQDNRSLAFIDVELTDSKAIGINRVQIRNMAARVLGGPFQALLVLYHSPGQHDYRLSFISKTSTLNEDGEIVTTQTAPKRYTYVLGPNESCTTAARRLLSVADHPVTLKSLIEAFNVEKLTKDFFKGYREHYERFWQYINSHQEYRQCLIDLEQESTTKAEKPIRDFAKKLLGRLVFLYFLQKKGWLGVPASEINWKGGNPRFLKDLFDSNLDKSSFYEKALVVLFFETLNRRRDNDIFELTNTKVPYLNGGLFENDSPGTNNFRFPVSYFSDLLEFFDQYNFTIDENSPEDAEVGIDPEMLGHIFENLLEENKDKGAFYTPKEVVQFICQEALIQYLDPNFSDKTAVEDVIRNKSVGGFFQDRTNARRLDDLLDKVKICDPAIGSGAFPIGILQEIFEVKRFIFPFLSKNRFDSAEAKLRIIQNSIYGVDMDKGAVDIARLRFWLALVVDEDVPQPLPNLDYKIMQGDSLFSTFEGIDLSKIGTSDDDEVVLEEKRQLQLFGGAKQTLLVFDRASRDDLVQLIHDYFNPESMGEPKEIIRDRIDEKINKKIHASFQREKLDLRAQIDRQERIWKEQGVWGRLNEKSKEYKAYKNSQNLYVDFDQREQRIIDLQRKPNERPYFLWWLYFREVYQQGGFDIVVGNPPYFSVSKMPHLKELARGYGTYESTGDIYALFFERGHQLLRDGGVLAYITGSSWLRSNYGTSLRKFFRENTDPIKLIDLSDCQIFESATVLTTIMCFRKDTNRNRLRALRLTRKTQHAINSLSSYFNSNSIMLQNQPDSAWVVLDRRRYSIRQQIVSKGKKLKDWDIVVNRGLLTGFNEAYVINEGEREDFILRDKNSQNIIEPFLRGRDIRRFSYMFERLWLINSHNGIKEKKISRIDVENNYPVIYEHLKKFERELIRRFDQGDHWTNLRNCAYLEDFKKPKIIYPEITRFLNFAYDEKGYFTNNKCFIITGDHLRYLTSFLNSKLFRFTFEEDFPELQGNSRELRKVILEELPIIVPSSSEEEKIAILTDYLLFLNDPNSPRINSYADNTQLSGFFDDIMNHLVCELYFKEEMKVKDLDIQEILDLEKIEKFVSAEQAQIIGSVYLRLQKPGSAVRQRIALASIELPENIGQILSSTI